MSDLMQHSSGATGALPKEEVKNLHHKYRNIVFDLGGVLVHFNPRNIVAELFKDEQEIPYHLTKAVLSKPWYDMDRGIITPEQAVDALAEEYGRDHISRFLFGAMNSLMPVEQGIALFSKVKQKGYNVYLLSNLSSLAHSTIKKQNNIFNEFHGLVLSYQVGKVKPDPDIFEHLLTTYGLDPAECLFIDDLEININGAKAVGIDGLVCADHTFVEQELKKMKIID